MPLFFTGNDSNMPVGPRDPIPHHLTFDSDDEVVAVDTAILSGNTFLNNHEDSDNSDFDENELMKLPKIASSPRPGCSGDSNQSEMNNNDVGFPELENPLNSSGTTPPCKRIGALKLSALSKETNLNINLTPRLITPPLSEFDTPNVTPNLASPFHFAKNLIPSTPKPASRSKSIYFSANRLSKFARLTSTAKRSHNYEKKSANVNPFTPCNMQSTSKSQSKKKRSRTSFEGISKLDGSLLDPSEQSLLEDSFSYRPSKRVALNISRYNEEFVQICQVGSGEFGNVYKCKNRLDGCLYAVKKSVKEVSKISDNQMNLMNEVYAHAAIGKHNNVVGYFSAWTEDGHMYIQNEYCNGGSLADAIAERIQSTKKFLESELKDMLLQTAEGLKYIHSKQLVHLDIKPENILINRTMCSSRSSSVAQMEINESEDHGFAEIEQNTEEEEVTYKLGDFGHVTSTIDPDVEEGDSRYMPVEILEENYNNLSKADVFSLGMSIYEAASGKHIPNNGGIQHSRGGESLDGISHYSEEFQELLQGMTHPNPAIRPSAHSITQHKVLAPYADMSKSQLQIELSKEKFEKELLAEKLKDLEEQVSPIKAQVPLQKLKQSKSNHTSKRNTIKCLSTSF